MLCPYCGGVKRDIVFWGHRYTKERGKVQRYRCNECKRCFMLKDPYRHMWYGEHRVCSVLSLHSKGMTEQDTADEVGVCWRTVERWLAKFTNVLVRLLANKKPRVCQTLHCDELFLKMCKSFVYVWDSYVSELNWLTLVPFWWRDTEGAKRLLEHSPHALDCINTDGAFAYWQPIRETYGLGFKNTQHIVCQDDSKYKNNVMEGQQSIIRRFTRPRRGFRDITSVARHLQRFEYYRNFVRDRADGSKPPAVRLNYVHYPPKTSVKQRFAQLLQDALSFWRLVTHRQCQESQERILQIWFYSAKN